MFMTVYVHGKINEVRFSQEKQLAIAGGLCPCYRALICLKQITVEMFTGARGPSSWDLQFHDGGYSDPMVALISISRN